MAAKLYLGTSGFAFPEWKGGFYPSDLKNADMLRCYATRLSSVEINHTFRRFPRAELLESWRNQASDGFRFALKAHQRITHRKRLVDTQRELEDFTAVARTLQNHLGPILFQCPPFLQYEPQVLQRFLDVLPEGVKYAIEFRHPSFDVPQVRDMLASRQVAWCVVDAAGQAPAVHTTAPFWYIRMRDDSIAAQELTAWAKIVLDLQQRGDVYVYFMHETLGATEALKFQAMVSNSRPM